MNGKNLPANAGDLRDAGSVPGFDPLEKEMATHSSILAWKTPWTEEPGSLQSTGSQSRTLPKRLSTRGADSMCRVLCEGNRMTEAKLLPSRSLAANRNKTVYR